MSDNDSIDKDEIATAYEDVRSDKTETSWALFGYDGKRIVLSNSGSDYAEFQSTLTDDQRYFGFVRMTMGDEMSKRAKFVLITWIGNEVSAMNKARMSTDKNFVKQIIKSVAVEIQTSDPDEVTEDYIRDELAKAGGANYGTGVRAETDE